MICGNPRRHVQHYNLVGLSIFRGSSIMQDLGDHGLIRPGTPHGRAVASTVASDPTIRGLLTPISHSVRAC
jgi:hypothetical protein